MPTRIWQWVLFVGTVAVFFYDMSWGWRAVGLQMIGFGVWSGIVRKVPYGIEGQAPSGYVTGWVAVLVGAIAVLIGLVMIVAPESMGSQRG